jgi:hypothetical protein
MSPNETERMTNVISIVIVGFILNIFLVDWRVLLRAAKVGIPDDESDAGIAE